ncbi:MAG: hypothetical protein R3F13_00820 [Prosthecobacter sp.]
MAKFLSLLRNRSIFLCRADLFDDVFEGTFTKGSLQEQEIESGSKFPDELVDMARWIVCRSYVSCWHVSSVESAALWKIYAGSDGAIAMKSSIRALKECFPDKIERHGNSIVNQSIRSVQYIDYRTAHPYLNDLAGPLCYKRQAFRFEQEIRVIRQELPTVPSKNRPNGKTILLGPAPDEKGLEIQVNIERLIDTVYLAPSSPSWMLPTIRDTLKNFGMGNINCQQSSLDELPEFGRLIA